MGIIKLKIEEVKPYENNPRKNDNAVAAVAESIKQCGYCSPIIACEQTGRIGTVWNLIRNTATL